MATKIHLSVNRYAFHWAYPEILADELGIFSKYGLAVEWYDATPSRLVNKGVMYTDLLRQGLTDVYHAGEWACIARVLKSGGSWIVAKSAPGRGTLNSSFSLYVRKESQVKKAADLADRSVAIEAGTGSQYTAMVDLEDYIPRASIKLVEQGEPHKRLVSLLNSEVESASLVGPWADIGSALGLRRVLRTRRSNPTTIVVRSDTGPALLKPFFRAVNEAVGRINANPERFKPSYFKLVRSILEEMPSEVSSFEGKVRKVVSVSRWELWEPYTAADFEATYSWMTERNLAPLGHYASEVVAHYPVGLFSMA